MNTRVTNSPHELRPTPGVNDQALDVGNAVIGLGPLNDKTTHVLYSVDGGDARVCFDGTNPTGADGHFLADKTSDVWRKEMAAALRIRRDGNSNVHFHITELTY
jgi:hypothetical protein